jgi:hypothetical protein
MHYKIINLWPLKNIVKKVWGFDTRGGCRKINMVQIPVL